jgi:muscarinic acetylcholine receptor M3
MNNTTLEALTSGSSWNSPYHPAVQALGWIVAALLSLETIIGNAMVVLAYRLERSISKQASNLYILSLAISDLIIGIEGFPLFTVYVINGDRWPLGSIACDTWLFLDYTLCLVSILTVLLITADRYLSVCHTAKYLKWQSPAKIKWLIFFSWIIPAVVFGAMIYGWSFLSGQSTSETHSNGECFAPFLSNPYVNMGMYLAYYWTTLIAMLILYKGIHKAAKNLEKKAKAKEHRHIALLLTQRLGTQVGVSLMLHSQRQESLRTETKDSGYHTNNLSTNAVAETIESNTESKTHNTATSSFSKCLPQGLPLQTTPRLPLVPRNSNSPVLNVRRKKTSLKSIKSVPLNKEVEKRDDVVKTPDADRRFQFKPFDALECAEDADKNSLLSTEHDGQHQSDRGKRETTASKHRSASASAVSDGEDETVPCAHEDISYQTSTVAQGRSRVHNRATAQRRGLLGSLRKKFTGWVHRKQRTKKSTKSKHATTSRSSSVSSSSTSSVGSPKFDRRPSSVPKLTISRDFPNKLSMGSVLSSSTNGPLLSSIPGSSRKVSNISSFTHNARERMLSSLFMPIIALNRGRKQTKAEKRAHKAFRTITFIVGLFAVLWSPYYIVATVYGFCKGECIPAFLYNLSYYMCYLNSSGNPFAYALANRQFRSAFMRIFRGNFQRTR